MWKLRIAWKNSCSWNWKTKGRHRADGEEFKKGKMSTLRRGCIIDKETYLFQPSLLALSFRKAFCVWWWWQRKQRTLWNCLQMMVKSPFFLYLPALGTLRKELIASCQRPIWTIKQKQLAKLFPNSQLYQFSGLQGPDHFSACCMPLNTQKWSKQSFSRSPKIQME